MSFALLKCDKYQWIFILGTVVTVICVLCGWNEFLDSYL